MKEVSIVGLDLAKRVFQVHAAAAGGEVVFRRKLSRGQVIGFFMKQPACVVAMEACATSHYWAREIGKLGHEVRLLPPAYVKPFVKRQKNDAADAEAIVEAALRPSMRFVIPKTESQQACTMIFRTRDLFVRQRTQLINALRAHLAEHGVIAPQGIANVASLAEIVENENSGLDLIVVETARLYVEQIDVLSCRIAGLEKVLKSEAKRSESINRLMSMPGMGPITAMAIEAFAPTMTTFKKGRDFAAWLGLVPKQHSSGGKQVLGRTSKMGQRDIRRLLIIGAMTVIRWACRKAPSENSWLARMLMRKPRMLVAIALANKMARSIWAMMTRKENYRDSVLAAA
jgi:transposase